MKIAITGAAGFIGRHLTLALKGGHEVLALTRQAIHCTDPALSCIRTDYSLEELRQLLQGCSAVIHLSAQRTYAGENANLLENGQLDYRLLQAAEDCGVNHVVQASTRGVYGTAPVPWLETTPPEPNSLYALAKLHAEATAGFFVRRGLCISTLRIAQVFGLGEYQSNVVTTFIRNAYHGKPITLSVKGIRREYIYIRDLIRAIERVLLQPVSGIYNLGSGEVVSLEDMAQTIYHAFGRQDGIIKKKSRKDVNEYSLMDSSRFRECFSWSPEWSFASAANDIARMLEDKNTAKYYGISAS